MVITMDISLITVWFTTHNWRLVTGMAIFMAACAIWALRYPGSAEEYQRRREQGLHIGWFK
jgi:hypothetical protein